MFRTVIITVSDRCFSGEMSNESGPLIEESLPPAEYTVVTQKIVPDEIDVIKGTLLTHANKDDVDLILTTGGTGFTPRDVTPEATAMVLQKRTPGIDMAIFANSYNITPHAMLSRAISGIRNNTLIINLPGNPKAIEESINVLIKALPHGLKLIAESSEESDHDYDSN